MLSEIHCCCPEPVVQCGPCEVPETLTLELNVAGCGALSGIVTTLTYIGAPGATEEWRGTLSLCGCSVTDNVSFYCAGDLFEIYIALTDPSCSDPVNIYASGLYDFCDPFEVNFSGAEIITATGGCGCTFSASDVTITVTE